MNTLILILKQILFLRQVSISLFILTLSINPIKAQSTQPLFKKLNKEFPDMDICVNDIARDSRGYIWIAGGHSLQRFDGNAIKQYLIKDNNGYMNYYGTLLFEDSKKNLWISCNGLLLLYDPSYDDFHHLKFDLSEIDSSEKNQITAINEDKKGNLWFALNSHSYPLIRIPIQTLLDLVNNQNEKSFPINIDQEMFEVFPSNIDVNNNYTIPDVYYVNKILIDRNGEVWIQRQSWIERFVEEDTMALGKFVRYLETRNQEGEIVQVHGRHSNNENVWLNIFVDDQENVWALTANCLYQFRDKNKDQIIPRDSTIQFSDFTQILYPRDEYDNQILPQGKWINTYQLSDKLNYHYAFNFPGNNNLWLHQNDGEKIDVFTMKFREDGLVDLRKINEIKKTLNEPINWKYLLVPHFLDDEGILWFSDASFPSACVNVNGIITLNVKNLAEFNRIPLIPKDPHSIPETGIAIIHKDYKRNLWLFPEEETAQEAENKLFLADPEFTKLEEVNFPHSDPAGDFLEVLEDPEHHMWFIGGLNIHLIDLSAFYEGKNSNEWHHKFNTGNFNSHATNDDYLIVHAMTMDRTNTVWMYTINYNSRDQKRNEVWGLYYFETDQLNKLEFDQYKNIRFQKFDQFKDPGDTLHFGFYNRDMYWDFWQPAFSLSNCLDVSRDWLYLISPTALIRINPETRDYAVFNSGSQDPSQSFAGIFGGGVVMDDPDKDSIYIYGVSDQGIKKITLLDQEDNKKLYAIKTYTFLDGFPQIPYGLIPDKKNNIWFMGDYAGIFEFNPFTEQIRNYKNEYTSNFNAFCKLFCMDREGYIYFHTDDGGINFFHPASLKNNLFKPFIDISDIKVSGKSIIEEKDSSLIEEIKEARLFILPYNRGTLSFDFNSLSLSDAKQNQYGYMLEGLDLDWIASGSSVRTATYSNLWPGSYTFRVKGSNNDGIWNEEGASLAITILPPWWLTWWAKAAYVMLFVGAIWGFIYLRTRKQKRKLMEMQQINDAFSKFVPYEFLHAIGREYIMDVKLGDKTYQDVTVLFLDIRNYTTLAESMTPDDNFSFIQKFVGLMGPIKINNRGFVNQYLDDGIMAILPEQVDDALKAAIDMQKELANYNQRRVTSGKERIRMGVGLHTGPLIMGIIGDEKRSDPATIADTVNTASRLEGMTKYYGIRILISGESLQLFKSRQNYHARYLGEVLVKGKNRPIKVYECFDGDEENIRDKKLTSLKQFEEGLKYYYIRDFSEAIIIFNHITEDNPEDRAASYYYSKAVSYALKGVPDDWTGVEKMEMK